MENSLEVILNAVTTSLVRPLENRFNPSDDFKHMQLYLMAVSLKIQVYMQSV